MARVLVSASPGHCCRDWNEVGLPHPGRCSGDPDGDGLRCAEHRVQHRYGDGNLAVLGRQAAGAQLGADQVLVVRHGRLSLVPSAVTGRALPAHAATFGHKLDVAVTLALGVAVDLCAWHRRSPEWDGDERR